LVYVERLVSQLIQWKLCRIGGSVISLLSLRGIPHWLVVELTYPSKNSWTNRQDEMNFPELDGKS
jgi:hypothetical protein